jgi:acyl-CoA thioesterase FadM
MQDRFKIGLFELAKTTGIGFYATQSEIKYLRPIMGVTTVEVESHVGEVQNGSLLKIPFRIFDSKSGKTYSEGRIDFSIVDVKTGRVTSITKPVNDLLFEEICE